MAVPPIQILDLSGPYEIFARCGGYQVSMVSSARGLVDSSCGLRFAETRHYREFSGPVDTLIVPGGTGAEELRCDDDFLDWLSTQAQTARRVCSVCTGAFVLARTGLLDGRRTVTHWNWCDRLAARFPKLSVESAPLFVKDGPFYSSGGVTAGMDLALALVEEDQGSTRAREIAQDLVMFLRRGAGQSQYSAFLAPPASPQRTIEELCTWMAGHLAADLGVAALAQQCRMSPRHFARVFTRTKGVTPSRFVETLRVSVAESMLADPSAEPKRVASLAGFSSAATMRRSLRRLAQGLDASKPDSMKFAG